MRRGRSRVTSDSLKEDGNGSSERRRSLRRLKNADSSLQDPPVRSGGEDKASHKRIKVSSKRKEGDIGPGPSRQVEEEEDEGKNEIEDLKRAHSEEVNQLKMRIEVLASENEALRKELHARDEELLTLCGKNKEIDTELRDAVSADPMPVVENKVVPAGCDMTSAAFQMFLASRKDEMKREAERKRHEGLQEIQERKSKTGINPLERFPKEIWAKIMNDLSPQDLANLRGVHSLFCDLTEKNHVRDVVFPLVIADDLLPLERVSPFNGYFYTMLKKIRPISKNLRDAVDQYIENRILRIMRTTAYTWEHKHFACYKFSVSINNELQVHPNKALAFSTGPEDLRPKRFVKRAIQVSLVEPIWQRNGEDVELPVEERQERFDQNVEILKENVTKLLEIVGEQILYFDFNCKDIKTLEERGMTISKIYKILREWLLLMPKLKYLKLRATGLKSLPKQAKWIREAKVGLEKYPMPTMDELERIDMTVQSTVHSYAQGFPIWDAILTANPHIKIHTYDTGEDSTIPFYERYTESSVQSLQLETVSLGCRLRMWDFLLLRKICSESTKWNLSRLELMMNMNSKEYGDGKEGGMNDLFSCLERFPQLEDLSLGINHVKFEGDINFLMLPNLKKLRIEIGPTIRIGGDKKFHHFFSLQFLINCGKLEELQFHNLHIDSSILRRQLDRLWLGHNDGIVDFHGGLRDLSKSNCWDVFPKLKSVKVQFREWAAIEGERDIKKRSFCRKEYLDRKLIEEDNSEWKIEQFFE